MQETAARLAPLALAALLATPTGAEEITLRFRPDAGAKLDVVQRAEQKMTMNLGAMGTRQMSSEMRMQSTQTVLGPGETGGRRVEFTFDRVQMSLSQGGAEVMNMDSESSEGEAASPFGAMAGSTFILEIDERGTVVATEGLEEMLDQVLDASDNPQAKAILQQSFGEETLMQNMQISLPIFPESALDLGDSWRHDSVINIAAFGTVSVAATYTVEELSEFEGEPCVRLGAEMEMELDFNAPMLEQLAASAGEEADISMDVEDVEANGWMCVAASDGVTLESEVRNQLVLVIAISAEGQEPMQMRMELDQLTRQTASRSG